MAQSNLRHGALSTFDTVGQSIAMNGPAATVSLYLVALASFSGFNMTFVLLVSFIIYVAITYVIYQWSKIVDSPAPWMKYASMGLGNGVGFVSGWIYWIYYIVGFGGFGLLGISAFLNSLGGVMQYRWLWYVVVIVMTVEALIIVLRRVELSTRYFIVMGLVEILFLVATSLLLLWLFRTNLHYVSSMNISSIKPLALILGLGAFGGISGLTPLSSETKSPTRSVPLSILISLLLIGCVIILSSFAQSIVLGPKRFYLYSVINNPGYWIYGRYLGIFFSVILLVLILNSFNSSLIATSNNYTRMFYGISREGHFGSRRMPQVNSNGIPQAPAVLGAVTGLSIALLAGTIFGPFEGSIFLLVMAAILSYSSHIIVSISLGIYSHKIGRLRFVRNLLIPGIASLVLIYAIVTIAINNYLYPFNISVALSVVIIVSGIIAYFISRESRRGKLRANFIMRHMTGKL
jgi:amino acid transporter